MGMYGSSSSGSAPKADPRIGQAALENAQLGREYLTWMQGQAATSNAWAAEDRERYQTVFQPLQDQYIAEAQEGPDYAGVQTDVDRATADVRSAFDQQQAQQQRSLTAMGVNPASGRSMEANRRSGIAEAAATASAANTTRQTSRAAAEAEADAKLTNAINMGSGLAVNPATSLSLSNSATSSGYNGAMSGNSSMASILNQQYGNQLAAYNTNQATQQANQSSLWGGLGSIAGLGAYALMSSKDYKTNKKKPSGSLLDAVNKMPVEEWDYKEGIADGGSHVGPYAEDFQKATGKGDGKSIPVVDAVGTLMGAVQELDKKVEKMAGAKR